MSCFPLCIIALAAGVHLVIKTKREYLGSLYSGLSWLVVVLSLACMGYCGFKHFSKRCCKGDKCIEKRVIIKDGVCEKSESRNCHMNGCKMLGDSCVMDQAACEKMMGVAACDSLRKLRGGCVFGKDECKALCRGKADDCCAKPSAGCAKVEAGANSCGKKDADAAGCCKKEAAH